MSSDYAVLAPIYDRIDMSGFAETMTPRLLNYAQRNDWLGRRVLDLGCGTGTSTHWFAQRGYNVVSVDHNPAMLERLHEGLRDHAPQVTVQEMDVRELDALELTQTIDMTVAFGLMNEMENLRDLERVLKSVGGHLQPDKYFIFDMYTIQGLTELGQAGDRLIHDDPGLVVFRRSTYDFERQIADLDYIIFEAQSDMGWTRDGADVSLRAYPVQAVATLLRRSGFEMVGILDTDVNQVEDLVTVNVPRVVFVYRKV